MEDSNGMDASAPPESKASAVLDGLEVDHGKQQRGGLLHGRTSLMVVRRSIPALVMPLQLAAHVAPRQRLCAAGEAA